MDNLFIRSVSAEALRAELHRSDLLRGGGQQPPRSGSVHAPDLEWPRRDEHARSHPERPR